jgi:hypothetical protein
MAHPPYLREKARKLRTERKMSLDEIAECLALGKTTVWYWIKDLPDPEIKFRTKPERRAALLRAQAKAAEANRRIAKEKRDLAYQQGWCEFAVLDAEPGFRDFVCMYIGEGYKKNRNRVSISNSDPHVVRLGDFWIRRFAVNPVDYSLQYHADQDPDRLIRFWSNFLAVGDERFRLQRKSNSNQLTGRMWRSKYGVLAVTTNDTHLRARVQGWIDRVERSWLDSMYPRGVAQSGRASGLGPEGSAVQIRPPRSPVRN